MIRGADRVTDRGVPITTSSTASRIKGYIAAGDIHLSHDDMHAIDEAGKKASRRSTVRRSLTALVQVGAVAWMTYTAGLWLMDLGK